MFPLLIVHFPLVLPLLGRGRLGWWGHIVVEYSLPVATPHKSTNPHIAYHAHCLPLMGMKDTMILMDISAFHLKGFSLSLLQMLCYLFASQSHWASPTSPHSLDDDDMDQDLDEEENCFCCCRLLILIHIQMTQICLQVRSTWGWGAIQQCLVSLYLHTGYKGLPFPILYFEPSPALKWEWRDSDVPSQT